MCSVNKKLFSPVRIGLLQLKNRVIRSATYEGMADENGSVDDSLAKLYCELALGGVGCIVTGFCFISEQARAMQPYQAGIDNDNRIMGWQKVVRAAKSADKDVKLIMQISHSGRQTLSSVTGREVVGAGTRKCSYFRQKVRALTCDEVNAVIDQYVVAACRAKLAGFDGVQVHGAHGYLVHQFLSLHTNNRTDKWADKSLFLSEILRRIRRQCGDEFAIFVKLSGQDDSGLTISDTIKTVNSIENFIDAVEISYGTMEYALNIIRGSCPVDIVMKVNPVFSNMQGWKKWLWRNFLAKRYTDNLVPFTNDYNLEAARAVKNNTSTKVITVGGIRELSSMENIICQEDADLISLCRPLICEPDLVAKAAAGSWIKSKCSNCNLCTINCDSKSKLRCYGNV